VGRTGVLIPNAVLEPVEIGGVVVERATLHNFDYIAEKDIRIGDRVLLKRAGEVIPYVIGPVADARTGAERKYVPPKKCPDCGEPVEHLEEVAWCASAPPARKLFTHGALRLRLMDIVRLGYKIVRSSCPAVGTWQISTRWIAKRSRSLTKKDRKSESEPPSKIANNLCIHRCIAQAAAWPAHHRPGRARVGEVMAGDLARSFDLDALTRQGR
jgi:DNA ligase (NAD+)